MYFQRLTSEKSRGLTALFAYRAGVRRESSQQREADLRALQGHQAAGRDSHHLQAQSKTQAKAGLIMARIAGVDLPREKKVEIGLTYIFAMGRARARRIWDSPGVTPEKRFRDLNEADTNRLRR